MKDMLTKLESAIVELSEKEILSRFNQVGHSVKDDGSLVTEADMAMQQAMNEFIMGEWPQYSVLGEEMPSEQQQSLLDEKFTRIVGA